jgi:YesN/AraC family two-component response regulator
VSEKANEIKKELEEIFNQTEEEDKDTLMQAVDYISEWSNVLDENVTMDDLYIDFATENTFMRTVSINGNEDREYIKEYINNMRMSEAKKYREYMFENTPGIDTSIEIQMPESDGGGSFTSFLRYGDTIFLQ